MKTLVVPVDFSPNSLEAARYAFGLATDLGASLVLMHAYDPLPADAPAHEWLTSSAQAEYFAALSGLQGFRNQLLTTATTPVSISLIAQPGDPQAVIRSAIESVQPDWVVMSLTGSQPRRARQEGSLTTALIGQLALPMLIVPPGVVYRKPQTLLLGLDFIQPIDAVGLGKIIGFANQVGAVIDVVCVDDEPTEAQRHTAQHIRHLLRAVPHTLSFVSGYDIATIFNQHVAEHRIDLVVLFPNHHPFWQRWLAESNTQEVARLSAVPVLATV